MRKEFTEGKGQEHLIEVNPRATPICHLAVGNDRSLPLALYSELTGRPPRDQPFAINQSVIAMFPGEWQRDSSSPYLRSAYHDVPWPEANLVRDGIDGPWAERGLVARLWARRRHRARSASLQRESPSVPADGTAGAPRRAPASSVSQSSSVCAAVPGGAPTGRGNGPHSLPGRAITDRTT